MKTLVVKYLPSGEYSKSKKLLDLFLEETKNQNIAVLDLLKTQVPLFDENSIQAYYKRNYGGQTLDKNEAKLLEKNDQLIAQLKSADLLVMAYPMHNFGIPAPVKAYLDAVIFKGETFDSDKKMMAGKKVLTLFTSAGIYAEDKFDFNYPNWNSIALNTKAIFSYMGFDESEIIGTSLLDETKKEERLKVMKEKIEQVVKKWYN
ncbi:MAG: NAD(P)H-dependent oxidoreductase [Proteobacteria bacterium]|nr:NAD(P)H-dependent oxidoreductase [Pseudomonadota bacterium]